MDRNFTVARNDGIAEGMADQQAINPMRRSRAMKINQVTREVERFYETMGPLFGSRTIAKEVGINLYDDPDKQWFVCAKAGKVVACASLRGNVVSDCYVVPEMRKKGIFTAILAEIVRHSEGSLRAACTPLSVPIFKERGFKVTRKTKNFTFMELPRA